MPPIPVYTSSPISAAKAAGATPQTDAAAGAPAGTDGSNKLTPRKVAAAPLTAGAGARVEPSLSSSSTTDQAYPPAQPGARPSLPAPTGVPAASASLLGNPQPTPTQAVNDSAGPPAPQPGAVPLAPGAAIQQEQHQQHRNLPPPPKAGEPLQPQTSAQPPVPMPVQMSYPPPQPSYAAYGGSSTTTAAPVPPPSSAYAVPAATSGASTFGGGPQPVLLSAAPANLEHPPGYQQDVNAAEFSSHQRAAHNASLAESPAGIAGPSVAEGTEKAWDAAKKWAAAAGESLAAAENEVWKRINKS
jgi:hypothetical protein